MCEKENEYNEDYGNILAELDENKTNEEEQKKYDEARKCF